MEPKLHPAVTVTNIKTFIPITLQSDSSQYATWSELFRIHCRAFLVSDHLAPREPTPSVTPSPSDKEKKTAPTPPPSSSLDSWERLDAIVLQWIYGTISIDLLHTILKTNTTAYEAWTALESLFQDNKATRALYLKQKFNSTRLESFQNMASYCQELKVLADQLSNVDAPVDDSTLVLQTLAGLTETYEGIAVCLNNHMLRITFICGCLGTRSHVSFLRRALNSSVMALCHSGEDKAWAGFLGTGTRVEIG